MRVYVDAQRRKARRLVDAELFSSVTQVEHTCPWGEARTEVFNDPLDKDVLASRRERYMSAVRELYRNPLHSSLSSVDLAKRPDSLPVGGKTSAPLWRTIASEQLQRRPFYLVDGLGTVRRPRRVVRVLDHQARIDELVDQAIYGALVRHHFANQRPQSFELLLRGVSKDPKIGCVHLRMTTELPEMDIDNGGVQVQGQSTRKPRVEPTTVLVIDVEVIFEADALAGDALRVMNGSYHTSRLLLGGEALDEHVALIRHEQRLCRRGVEQRVRFLAPPLRPGDEAIGEVRRINEWHGARLRFGAQVLPCPKVHDASGRCRQAEVWQRGPQSAYEITRVTAGGISTDADELFRVGRIDDLLVWDLTSDECLVGMVDARGYGHRTCFGPAYGTEDHVLLKNVGVAKSGVPRFEYVESLERDST